MESIVSRVALEASKEFFDVEGDLREEGDEYDKHFGQIRVIKVYFYGRFKDTTKNPPMSGRFSTDAHKTTLTHNGAYIWFYVAFRTAIPGDMFPLITMLEHQLTYEFHRVMLAPALPVAKAPAPKGKEGGWICKGCGHEVFSGDDDDRICLFCMTQN